MATQTDFDVGETNVRHSDGVIDEYLSNQSEQIAETTASKIRSFLYELAEGTSNYRSLHSLTEQVEHQYHGRFVIELIQNAHDALLPIGQSLDQPARIEIALKDDGEFGTLYVANDGSPFSISNFNSLSQLGQSDKNPQQSIGNKGIGFRSVLEISAEPKIYSRIRRGSPDFDGFRFTFSPSKVRELIEPVLNLWSGADDAASPFGHGNLVDWEGGLLKKFRDKITGSARSEGLSPREWLNRELSYLSPYLLPFPLNGQPDSVWIEDYSARGFSTLVCLPLKYDFSRRLVREKIDELKDDALLFLENASSVILDDGDQRRDLARIDQPRLGGQTGRVVTISNANSDSKQEYWVWTRDLLINQYESVWAALRQLPGKWPQLEEATVSIAVRLATEAEPGVFSIFLPTLLTTGCSAHINAPFFGDMSRTDIDFGTNGEGSSSGAVYNQFLLTEAARLAVATIQNELANQGPDEARAIIDLLAAWPKGEAAAERWQQMTIAAAEEAGVAFDEAEWFLSDHGWVSLNKVSLLPAKDNATVITKGTLRRHATFAAHIEELESRRFFIEALSKARGIDPFPIEEDLALTVEKVARELQASVEADWNGFWTDADELFRNGCACLVGKRVLLGNDGELHSGGSEECTVFFTPRQGTGDDQEIENENDFKEIPSSLKPFVAFLSEKINIYEEKNGRLSQTRARKVLLDSKLVSAFRREDILKDVLVLRTPSLPVSLDGTEAALCRDILLWAFRLMAHLVALGKGGSSLELLKELPAPCAGGWYPLGGTAFGPGWPSTLGNVVHSYLRSVKTPQAQATRQRLLLPPTDERWAGSGVTISSLLRSVGVFDGLKLTEIQRASWGSRFQSNKNNFQLPQNMPNGLSSRDWSEYREFAAGEVRPVYNSGSYQVQKVHSFPGLDRYAEFSEATRKDFMEIVLGSSTRWDAGWDALSIVRVEGNSDHLQICSPLAYALRTLPWLGLTDGEGLKWARPRDRWHVPSLELGRGRKWQFAHLRPLPGELAHRLDADQNLANVLYRLGTPLFDPETKNRSTQLLDALVDAVDRDEVPNWDVFLGQVRSAWRGFDPPPGVQFPQKILVQRTGSKLTAVVPNEGNPVYLPDSAKTFLAALKHFELPVVAIETDEARRLGARFARAFPKGLVLASSLQTILLVNDEPWNGKPEERLRDDPELEWLIPVLLTIVGSYGPQSQGTASRSFKKHLDALRNARIAVVERVSTILSHQGTPVSEPLSVQAMWVEGTGTLLLRKDVKSNLSALSEALSDLLDRSDLDVPIRLVLGMVGSRPETLEILFALEQLKLSEDQYREAREHWRGDLGQIFEMLAPLLTIVSPEANIGKLLELDSDEAVIAFLDSIGHPKIDGAMLMAMARESNSIFDFGHRAFATFGEIVQLSEWNAALSLREHLPLKNLTAESAFKNHFSAAAQTLRSLIAVLLSRNQTIGTFKSLWDQIDSLNSPSSFRTSFWDISFNRSMSTAIPHFKRWLATNDELASIQDAFSAEDLAVRLSDTGLDVSLDPIEVARDNRDKLRRALVRLQEIGLAWALENRSSNAESWESRVDSYLEHLSTYVETIAFTRVWNDADVMTLLRKLPVDEPSVAFWAIVAVSPNVEELIKLLSLTEQSLLSANTKLTVMRESARRRRTLIEVCGKEFDGSEENLSGLWDHIRSGLPEDAVKVLVPIDLAHPNQLEKRTRSSIAGGGRQKPVNKTKQAHLSKSMENLIGLSGEIHAFRMLQSIYGSAAVSASTWISENSLSVFPDNKVSDGRGCDFEIVVNGRAFYIEVKSTEADGETFKMGSSEIRLAMELARKRRRIKDTYLILRVSNVLTTNPGFRLLPNPYDEKHRSFFTIEEADARISYRPKLA